MSISIAYSSADIPVMGEVVEVEGVNDLVAGHDQVNHPEIVLEAVTHEYHPGVHEEPSYIKITITGHIITQIG